jgi:hypothetical protein
LVSEWKFEGPTAVGGTAVVDDTKDSWTINGGTALYGTPTVKGGTDCVSGKCIYFDGSGEYIDTTNGSGFNNLTSYTIELWEKTSIKNKDFVNKAVAAGNQRSFTFWMNGSGYLEAYISSDGIVWAGLKTGTIDVANNKWNHVVVVYTGTNIFFYVNGISYEAPTSYTGGVYTSSATLKIGASYAISPFSGYMDEIRFYKQGVSFSQIEQNYYSGLNNLFKNNGIGLKEYNQRLVELKSNIANNE